MAYIQCFTRNRCTSVEKVADDRLRAICRLQDSLADASVEITAELPDLQIISATGRVSRCRHELDFEPRELLQKAVGVRVGPGMLKIFKGLIGQGPGRDELRYLLEECCEGVILSMTKGVLMKAPRQPEGSAEYFSKIVRKNVRLYNQCAAFRPDSPLVQGMEPPS